MLTFSPSNFEGVLEKNLTELGLKHFKVSVCDGPTPDSIFITLTVYNKLDEVHSTHQMAILKSAMDDIHAQVVAEALWSVINESKNDN